MPGATITLDSDTFTRANNASSWGTASSGSTWSTTLGTPSLSIASNEGHATNITSQANMKLGTVSSQNAEGLVRVKCNNSSSTRMGISLRQTASNTFYQGRLSANANNLVIGKIVSGTSTDLFTTAFTVTTGTFYWIRFRVVGSNLYVKAWADGSGEPGSWTLTGTDTSITGSGNIGLTINATSTTTTWDFDSFTVTDATLTETLQVRARIATQVTKTLQSRLRLNTLKTKTLQARFVLSTNLVTKTLQARLRLRTQATKTLQARLRLNTGVTKTLQVRAVIGTPPLTSGGFTLFANGAGTVSFDHFRATQYPDPSLSLAPVLPRLGSSNVAWNSNVPTNTALAVQTSLDGVNFSTATSGSSIPGMNGQPDPTIDTFISNTSANYTSTFKSGGSAATPTFDTTNSRLTLAGGSGGLYLNSSISCSDVDVICDMDESDAGGLVWRYQGDQLNYYELGAYDDSASGGFTNALRLYKVASGTRSLLGSASITWPRSTVGSSPYKRFRVTMLGAVITCYFDGTSLITYTDGSPLGAGKVGLRNDGGTSRYYQLRIQQQGDYVSGTPAGDVVTGEFAYTLATLTTSDPSVTPQLLDLTTSARSPQIATGALIAQLHDPSKTFATPYNKEMDGLTQASGDFYWGVGPDSLGNPASLTFAGRQATPAPWCLHSSDLKFSPTGPQTSIVTPTFAADLFRNRQTIYNVTGLTSTLTETKIADGSATSWTLAYPVYSMSSIVVQSVVQTVGVKSVDSGKQMYWQANNNTITQDSGATKIPSGYIITVTYVGQFNTSVTADNLASQAARAAIETGTSGIVEASEDGQGMLASAAQTYAQGLLNRYANNDAVQLVTTTTRAGLAKGMVLPTFISEHKLNNRQLLITQIVTTAEQDSTGNVLYYYTITATDGPSLNNWAAALGL